LNQVDRKEVISIELLIDTPQFLGLDGKSYGPYANGQIIEVIPAIEKHANIMVNSGIARQLNVLEDTIIPKTQKEWALYYHSLGFNVIPIKNKGTEKEDYKIPLLSEWKSYQTKKVTLKNINDWWSKWPTANIGIICGSISNLLVLDIDVDKGGLESLEKIAPKEFSIESIKTPTVKTGRLGGGLHLYFRCCSPLGKITNLMPGLDFQGEGSYVVAPPSVHFSGNYYTWVKSLSDFERMDMLPWVLKAIGDHNTKKGNGESRATTSDGKLKVGTRNTTLTSLSGELYNRGLNPDAIKKVLHSINKEISEDPLPEREVDAIKTSWPKRKFSDNDVGNAERMVHYFGTNFLYCPPEDQFYIWDGKRWCKDDMNVIWELAFETIKNIAKIEIEGLNGEEVTKLMELARVSFSNVKIKGMISCLKTQSEVKVNPDYFDKNPYVLCCKNGTLDLLNMEFREHRKEDYITMMAGVEYIEDARSDLWENFITRILPDDDVRLFVQKITGLSLNGAILEQRYYCCYGKRDNGKSRFTEAIKNTLGDFAQVTPFNTFEKRKNQSGQARSDIVRMQNKRLIIVHEVPEDANKLDDNLIKSITGGDAITSRGLYKDEEEFIPTTKLIFEGNHKLKYSGYEPSFIKRTIYIHFDVTIPEEEQDKELPEKLKDPYVKSAILNWMYEGWKAYKKDIMENNKLTIPPKVKNITTITNLENDPVGFFIQKCCSTEKDNIEKSSDLFTAYENFARLEGLTAYKIQKFGRIMTEKAFEKERSGKGIFYKGIKVQEDWRIQLIPTNAYPQNNYELNPDYEEVEGEA